MNFIVDLVIIVIALVIILVSRKRGFFKTVISFASYIASFVLAVAFSPKLATFFYEEVFLEKIASNINSSLSSIASVGDGLFDVSKLIGNDTFNQLVTRFGGNIDSANSYVEGINDTASTAVDRVSYYVASPLAQSISSVLAFVLVFAVSLLVLKLITLLLAQVFKLPVLKEIDKTLGLIVGILCAFLFIIMVVVFASNIGQLLTAIAPSMFTSDIVEKSFIVSLFSKIGVFETITNSVTNTVKM